MKVLIDLELSLCEIYTTDIESFRPERDTVPILRAALELLTSAIPAGTKYRVLSVPGVPDLKTIEPFQPTEEST